MSSQKQHQKASETKQIKPEKIHEKQMPKYKNPPSPPPKKED